jgi:hypothetical protein
MSLREPYGDPKVEMLKATAVIGNCFEHNSRMPGLTLKHALPQGRRTIFSHPVHAINQTNAARESCIFDLVQEMIHIVDC